MGRGRAKAKQVKVARQLKYNSGGTDLERLRAELGVVDADDSGHSDEHDPYDELADRYADYAAVDDDDGDDDRRGRR
ncbi:MULTISPECIES: DUF3073 domain-containing protein [Microbispora]|jgi:hypothetical protein|uniref:DUF3073 domain-containing protein n=5 Tax=Microbispora TaxID=2005 RepID=A0A8H9LGI9_9ACTN|nr:MULTISPECIES: DUF3073 domain-containing protein [Microbispora]KAB8178801.1 DUF3073 family protein [Microbispora catharanthi]MBD3139745.1 DUF3073 domain-containing protein [Microbispora bryophytorum]MBD3146813.1 DUF3073 domain-containing protein [Microbispora camponoti]MBE3010966.1 DUF3073 domain-containing protein [Microbispora sitophila]NJP28245.1 DUF3073 domain-containing protein [Microbispora sp. CL1-1]